MTLKMVLLADIHGNLPALEAVLADATRNECPDLIWVLGDLVAFFPWQKETLDLLRSLPNVFCLRGNTDRYLVTGERQVITALAKADWDRMGKLLKIRDESFRWMVEQLDYVDFCFLRDLPRKLEMEVPGFGKVQGTHASIGDDEKYLFPDSPENEFPLGKVVKDLRMVLCGHSHVPMDRTANGVRYINPGSVGLSPGFSGIADYACLHFSQEACVVEFRKVVFDLGQVVEKLERSEYPGASGLLQKMRKL